MIKIGGSLLNTSDLEQGYYLYRYYGFDYVELCLRHNISPSLDRLNILKELNEVIPVKVAHLPNISLIKNNIQRNLEFIKMMGHIETVDTLVIHWISEETDGLDTFDKLEELNAYLTEAGRQGITLTIENTPELIWEYEKVLVRMPELGMTLDVGHANLYEHFMDALDMIADTSERIKHMHFHDNHAGNSVLCDTHMPFGAGTIDFNRIIEAMEKVSYDRTITLELKSSDKSYFDISRQKLKSRLSNS